MPTVFVPELTEFSENIAFVADAAGLSADFNVERARYGARIAETREIIGDPAAISVSRFDMWEDGLWYHPGWGAIAQVIDDLGFDKPEVQASATDGMDGVSVQRIEEFDGDILIASYAPRFGQTIPMLTDQWDEIAPFWRGLGGVQSGNLFWYERDILVGHTFDSLDRSIDFLLTVAAGREFE